MDCLQKMIDGDDGFDWDSTTIREAAGLLKWLEDEEFMVFLHFFHRVMPHVDILFQTLQKRDISVDMVKGALDGFTEAINKIRREVDNFPSPTEAGPSSKRQRTSSTGIKAACKEACDVMLSQAADRFSNVEHLIPLQLVDPVHFENFNNKFPKEKLDMLPEYYPMISTTKLKSELQVLYERPEFQDAQTARKLLQFMLENNLNEPFSEVVQLLEINATIPLTSSESERCFSTLKRIKTYLRNTMTNDRLNALAALSIQKELIRNIPGFNDRVINSFAQLKTRRADFLYKSFSVSS